MTKFGKLIGRANAFIRHSYSQDPQTLFSVGGMPTGELMKIAQDGEELVGLMKPIMAEYEHMLMENFFRNPDMTPGKIKTHYDNQFNFIITSVESELKKRQNKK